MIVFISVRIHLWLWILWQILTSGMIVLLESMFLVLPEEPSYLQRMECMV